MYIRPIFSGPVTYFHEFQEKIAFCENIIVNSYVSVALLQCYILKTISLVTGS